MTAARRGFVAVYPPPAAVEAIGPDPVGEPWTVTEVLLMASDTRPDGAHCTELARFPLGG